MYTLSVLHRTVQPQMHTNDLQPAPRTNLLQARDLGGDNFVFEDNEEEPVWAYEEQLRAKQQPGPGKKCHG